LKPSRSLVGWFQRKPYPLLVVEDPGRVDNHLHLLGDQRAAVEAQATDGIMQVRHAMEAIIVLAFRLAALGAEPAHRSGVRWVTAQLAWPVAGRRWGCTSPPSAPCRC